MVSLWYTLYIVPVFLTTSYWYTVVVMTAIDGISWISWEDVQGIQGYCCTDTCHFCGCPHTPQWAHVHYPTSLVHKGSTARARCKEFWVVFCSDAVVLLPEILKQNGPKSTSCICMTYMYVSNFLRNALTEMRHSACNLNFVNLAALNAFRNINHSKYLYMYLQATFVEYCTCISFYWKQKMFTYFSENKLPIHMHGKTAEV